MKPNYTITTGTNSTTELHRISKDQVVKKTVFYNDKQLDQNTRLRNHLENSKHNIPIHDNAPTRAIFSFPSMEEYTRFIRKNPETNELMESNIEVERIKGFKQLELLHPEYCIYNRL